MWRSSRLVSFWCMFFFQAEDGIRDVAVTGVQTCALPILSLAARDDGARPDAAGAGPEDRGRSARGRDRPPAGRPHTGPAGHDGAVSARLELSDRPRLGRTLHRSGGAPLRREWDRARGAARAVR